MKTYNSSSSQNKESPEHHGKDTSNANIDTVRHPSLVSGKIIS